MKYSFEELDKIYKVGTEIFCTGFGGVFPPCVGKIIKVTKHFGSDYDSRVYTVYWDNDLDRKISGETNITILADEMIVIIDEKHKLSLRLKYAI